MKIKCIFEVIKDVLYAASFDGDTANVLDDLQDKWSDVLYLEEFFENNIKDLESGYFGSISVEEAVEETIEAADELFEKLYEADGANLDSMFVPLDNREFKEYDFQKMKARRGSSWLRLYAVHYFDQYVITGGAIKLT
ncbi:MAG: hypothetical protein ACOCWM_00435 [Cyclobacteriaceae bacterium]